MLRNTRAEFLFLCRAMSTRIGKINVRKYLTIKVKIRNPYSPLVNPLHLSFASYGPAQPTQVYIILANLLSHHWTASRPLGSPCWRLKLPIFVPIASSQLHTESKHQKLVLPAPIDANRINGKISLTCLKNPPVQVSTKHNLRFLYLNQRLPVTK